MSCFFSFFFSLKRLGLTGRCYQYLYSNLDIIWLKSIKNAHCAYCKTFWKQIWRHRQLLPDSACVCKMDGNISPDSRQKHFWGHVTAFEWKTDDRKIKVITLIIQIIHKSTMFYFNSISKRGALVSTSFSLFNSNSSG